MTQRPQWTEIPNKLIEAFVALQPQLSGADWKVLMHIARSTYGYRTAEKKPMLTPASIAAATGLSVRGARYSLDRLESRGCIVRGGPQGYAWREDFFPSKGNISSQKYEQMIPLPMNKSSQHYHIKQKNLLNERNERGTPPETKKDPTLSVEQMTDIAQATPQRSEQGRVVEDISPIIGYLVDSLGLHPDTANLIAYGPIIGGCPQRAYAAWIALFGEGRGSTHAYALACKSQGFTAAQRERIAAARRLCQCETHKQILQEVS